MSTRASAVVLRLGVTALALGISVSVAQAAPKTWTGTTDLNWATPGNWVGGVAPSAGDDLIFPVGGSHTSNFNNFPAGTSFNSITYQAAYTSIGNAITLGAGGLNLTAGVTATFSADITVGAAQTWSETVDHGTLFVTGAVHLNGHPLAIDVSANLGLADISGVIDGTGALTKTGIGALELDGANTYAGVTTVSQGYLTITNASALGVGDGTAANGTVVTSTGAVAGSLSFSNVPVGQEWVQLSGNGQSNNGALQASGICGLAGPLVLQTPAINFNVLNASLILNGPVSGPGGIALGGANGTLSFGNTHNSFTGGLTMHGPGAGTDSVTVLADQGIPGDQVLDLGSANTLTVNSAAQTLAGLTGTGKVVIIAPGALILDGSTAMTFGGVVSNVGALIYSGSGHQTFTGANTSTGLFSIAHGLVSFSGASAKWQGGITVVEDGALSMTGGATAQGISVSMTGHLKVSEGGAAQGNSGSIGLGSTSTFDVGSSATGLGKLTVTGTVSLGGANLNVIVPSGYEAATNTPFTIIDNDGTDPVSGTFAGLPEGATFTANGTTFRISYVGGTGNDVTLTIPGPREYLLTEGADSSFFTTDILLANPNTQSASIHITFLKEDGTTVAMDDTLAAMSHKFLRVNGVAGMESTAFSTIVTSLDGLPLVVERTMSWDATGYGAHSEHATDGAAKTWYFAEGSQGYFHTYLLLANPQTTANTAKVQYLIEGGAPITRTYPLAPTSRFTVDAGADAALVNQSFGMIVTFAQPGAAERSMYFGMTPLFNGGHESAGVNAPSTTWFLAEGATGTFFETFVLLANPGDTDGTATMTYFPLGGTPVSTTKPVPAHARVTVNLEGEDPTLANAAVSTQVVSTQPILVERSQYWPNPAPNWYEAHNSFGVTALATKWGLSEGRVGNVDGDTNAQTYILLANPGTTAANVTITFLRDDPSTNVTHTFTVQPQTRFNVPVGPGTSVPELTNEHFGALVTSDQPIAVERALYWDANGQIWAAGTNATATALP